MVGAAMNPGPPAQSVSAPRAERERAEVAANAQGASDEERDAEAGRERGGRVNGADRNGRSRQERMERRVTNRADGNNRSG